MLDVFRCAVYFASESDPDCLNGGTGKIKYKLKNDLLRDDNNYL